MNAIQALVPSFQSIFRRAKKGARHLFAFARSESGAVATYFVLSAPVLFGGIALGAEVGQWYFRQQKLQSTADMLVISIAARLQAGVPESDLDSLASDLLMQDRLDLSNVSFSVVLAAPSGSNFVDGNTVNVQLTQPIKRIMTRFFGEEDFVIQASAAAQVNQATEGCILSNEYNFLDSITVNQARVRVTGCEVLANGSAIAIFNNNNSSLTADCVRGRNMVSTNGLTATVCRYAQGEASAGEFVDPYTDMPDLSGPSNCAEKIPAPVTISAFQDWTNKLTPTVISGRTFVRLCHDLTISGTGVTIPVPGWTFIFGDGAEFRIENFTNVTSTDGPLFYFEGGARPNINAPNSSVRLSAHSGQSGMLFRGARMNTLAATLNNTIIVGPNSNLRGAIYFPASPVEFQATGNVSDCMQIIGASLSFRGGDWQMTGPCSIPDFLRPIVASTSVRLIQ